MNGEENMQVEILVATMYRDDFDFLNSMNLWGSVIVMNQCNSNGFQKIIGESYDAKIINTKQRGLSNSRNEAIMHAKGDIILTADDDIVYLPDAKNKIINAFSNYPKADIIAFNIERKNSEERGSGKKNLIWRKAPSNRYYSSVSLAYKLSSLRKANLSFSTLFGAGGKYLSGEESLLLREARKKGLVIMESPEYIAEVDFSESSWFSGYDERFFFDKGAWISAAYPYMGALIKFYFIKYKDRSTLPVLKILQMLNRGIKAYKEEKSYDEIFKVK